MRLLKSIWQVGASQIKFFFVVFLGYLVQVCVMPYFSIGDVTPSILFALIAIITIGYGKLRALWVGSIYGILMETMCPTIRMLNLLLYPISAGFMSMFFADKTEKRLEYERSIGKAGRNVNSYLRTIGCAAGNTLIYEIVNILYMYLTGSVISAAIIGRGLLDILWTTLLTALIMIPVRRFLGFKKLKRDPHGRAPQLHPKRI